MNNKSVNYPLLIIFTLKIEKRRLNTMKKLLSVIVNAALCLILILPLITEAHLPIHVNSQPVTSLAPMLDHVTPTVVKIAVEKNTSPSSETDQDNPTAPTKVIDVGSG